MKLSTKIFLATSSVATLATITVAGSAVSSDYTNSKQAIVRALKSDLALVDSSSVDALDQALNLGDYSQVPVSIYFLDTNQKLSALSTQGGELGSGVQSAQVLASASKPIEVSGLLLAAKPLKTGGYLVVGASTRGIDERARQALYSLLGGYGMALLGIFALIWLILRRDLKSLRDLESASREIASGKFDVPLNERRSSTEITNLRKSLRSMVSELTKAVDTEKHAKKNMERFISDASHELRTPLTVIRGYAELLGSQKGSKNDVAERIIGQVDRMNELVADLLLLAQLNEQAEAREDTVWLDELALAGGEELAILNRKRPIAFDLQPTKIVTDKHLLQRFIANAVSNINRYTPQDAQARFSVQQGETTVSLRIEDAGPGLPEKAYSQGIQKFERFDLSRSRSAGGTGLGMSIMSSIATTLEGEVTLSKSSLGGLSIELRLPLNNAG